MSSFSQDVEPGTRDTAGRSNNPIDRDCSILHCIYAMQDRAIPVDITESRAYRYTTGKAQRASMAQEELQESKLTKAGGRKPTHGCSYPMV